MKRVLFFLFVLFLGVHCEKRLFISGKIYFLDENPSVNISVSLSKFGESRSDSIASIQAGHDGFFSLQAQNSGFYHLWVGETKKKTLRIFLDIEKSMTLDIALSFDKNGDLAVGHLSFDEAHKYLSDIFEISRKSKQTIADYYQSYAAFEKDHKGFSGFYYDFSDLQSFLQGKMDKPQNSLVKQFSALHLIQLSIYINMLSGTSPKVKKFDSKIFEEVVALVPPESPLWEMKSKEDVPYPEVEGFGLSRVRAKKFLHDIRNQNANRHARAGALFSLAKIAADEGEKKKQTNWYNELQKEYKDII